VDECGPMAHGLGTIVDARRRPLRQHYAVARRLEGRMCEDAIVDALGWSRKPSGSAEGFWKISRRTAAEERQGERTGSAGETRASSGRWISTTVCTVSRARRVVAEQRLKVCER
jgi:hypothetical protein